MAEIPQSLNSRFAAAGTGLAVLEAGRVVWANPSFERLFGACTGTPIEEAVGDVSPAFFEKALAKTGSRVDRFERRKGPRTFVYELEVVHTADAVGLIVRDESRVAERELILRSFGKKLERVNQRLESRNDLMRTLLDHAGDGFFGLDRRGRVLPEIATVLPSLLGHDPRGETLADMLPGENGAAVADLLALALDGTIPEALLRESLEYDWNIGERVLRLDLTPQAGDAQPRVLGKLRDVTAQRREESAKQQRAEYQALVTAAAHHPEHFQIAREEIGAFARALGGAVQDAAGETDGTRQQLLISVHTVKATTRAYQMEATTSLLHGLEARLAGGDATVRSAVVTAVLELDAQFSEVARLFGAHDAEQVAKVDRQALGALSAEVARLEGGARLAWGMRALLLQPLASELGGLESIARGTAGDRGKQVRVEVDAGSLRVDRLRLRALLAVLPHLVRNAVAHGIECPQARVQAGKPPSGLIRVRGTVEQDGGCLRLVVEDDGAGVDRDRLASRLEAQGHGMPLRTNDDVLAALCLPEVSTAEEADVHAGRGVGMSAVAKEVATLGGRLSLSSVRGQGTGFTIDVPVDRDDPLAVIDVSLARDAA